MINKANNIYGFYAPLVLFVAIFSSQAVALESETWHYGLDDVGNITSRGLDPLPANATHSYIYDGLYRLTDESNPNNTDQYDYDANSNRIGFTRDGSGITLQIDPTSNRLDQVDSDPRTHDDAGNTTSDRNGTRVFTYNDMGRLSAVHENSQLLASYTYNAQGQRAIKTTPTTTTYYDYDLSGALIGEYDEIGQVIKEYVHLNGEPVAQLQGTAIAYLHTDHLATPRKATNEAGQVIWEWDSEAFGNEVPVSGDGTEVDLRFPGQVYDDETGFYYNYFRYYDPATGRYITSDPIGLNAGLNTFAYVSGNPLRYTDMYGLAVDCKWIVTSYYDKVTYELVKPATGYTETICYPVPIPTISIPDPRSGGRRLPSPVDISYKLECIKRWVEMQAAEYKQVTESWMKGYMECTDDCTGKVTKHWSSDRRTNNPPNI